MSSEPVKIEVECAVAPYSHLHHHHHHHHHHSQRHHIHPALHDHHRRRHHASEADEDDDEDDDDGEQDDDDDDDERDEEAENRPNCVNFATATPPRATPTKVAIEDHRQHQNQHQRSATLLKDDDRSSNDSGGGGGSSGGSSINSDCGDQNQLELECNFISATTRSSSSSDSSSLSKEADETTITTSESSDEYEEEEEEEEEISGESSEQQEDNEDEEDDDDEDEGDDEDEDGADELDEDDSDNDSVDIVDPVGHQTHQFHKMQSSFECANNIDLHHQVSNSSNGKSDSQNHLLNEPSSDDDDDDDEEEGDDGDEDDGDEDDDVSFDGNCDENTPAINDSSTDLLNSERMLEVTRKLVRSTERDPDRDLRKQVLLKTAIRKLPHFIEYNRYSDGFDQNFQLHNNNNSNNNSNNFVNCLTTQYYEHQHIHINHHIDSQPKSYYHSVQPNAIQMSTTSLRKLDLNDDQDQDNLVVEGENHLNYTDTTNDHNGQTSLDHHQHDYSSHDVTQNLYDCCNQTENHHRTLHHPNDQQAIHDFTTYDQVTGTGCQSSMLGRHNALDNLYQPLGSNVIDDDLKTNEHPTDAFQTCNLDLSTTCQLSSTSIEEPTVNEESHLVNQNHQVTAHVEAYGADGVVTIRKPMKELETNTSDYSIDSSGQNSIIEDAFVDRVDCSEGGADCSQLTINSVDSVISPNISANSIDDVNSTSILETSLNSSNDFYHNSHDSGVALYSPRSNKRTSSSLGSDDEMEVDHSTDYLTSAQQNLSLGTNNNQYKKLRKREIIE